MVGDASEYPHGSTLAAWVRQARSGDATAWKRIEREIRRSVVSRLHLPPQVDPEEVAADTFAEVWQALPSLRDDQKILSFAATVARRVALKIRKDLGRHLPLTSEPSARQTDLGAKNLEGEELMRTISRALKGADEQLFRLLYVVGATSSEVQDSLGISGRLLRQRKHRLHRKLRRVFDPPGSPTSNAAHTAGTTSFPGT